MRPSHQTVGPALPVRCRRARPVRAEVPLALLPAHRRRVERGEERDPAPGDARDVGSRSSASTSPVAAAEVDLGGATAASAARASPSRPARPPLEVVRRSPARTAAASGGRARPARLGVEPGSGAAEPALRRRPSGTGCSSTSPRAPADDPPLGGEQESTRRRRSARPPNCRSPRRELLREPRHVRRELGRRTPPRAASSADRRRRRRDPATPRRRPRCRPRDEPRVAALLAAIASVHGGLHDGRELERHGRTACGACRASAEASAPRRALARRRHRRAPLVRLRWPGRRCRGRSRAGRRGRADPRSRPPLRAARAGGAAPARPGARRLRCCARAVFYQRRLDFGYRWYQNTDGIRMATDAHHAQRQQGPHARRPDRRRARGLPRARLPRRDARRDRRAGRLHEGRRLLELRGQGRPLPRAARRALRRARRALRGLVLAPDDAEETYRSIARVMLEAYEREPAWWPLVSDFSSHASRPAGAERAAAATREGFLDAVAAAIEQLCERHEMTFVLPAREVARGTGALMRGMAVEWAIDPSPADADAFEEMLAAYLRGLAVPSTRGARMTVRRHLDRPADPAGAPGASGRDPRPRPLVTRAAARAAARAPARRDRARRRALAVLPRGARARRPRRPTSPSCPRSRSRS